MEVKELIMHPAQLEQVELIKINCEKSSDFNEETTKFNITFNITSEVNDEHSGKSTIDVIIKGKGLYINIVEQGLFHFQDIEIQQMPHFLEVQGVRMLWSYVREIVYDISGKMFRAPILIPTIDVIHTIENAEKGRCDE